mmetsp:Transcript_6736/g.14684  ORF Transcript_6736/g.14684 Transcript_6736/m.14684 type:complete len:326 (-) Transcript_6736:324-1301(-)
MRRRERWRCACSLMCCPQPKAVLTVSRSAASPVADSKANRKRVKARHMRSKPLRHACSTSLRSAPTTSRIARTRDNHDEVDAPTSWQHTSTARVSSHAASIDSGRWRSSPGLAAGGTPMSSIGINRAVRVTTNSVARLRAMASTPFASSARSTSSGEPNSMSTADLTLCRLSYMMHVGTTRTPPSAPRSAASWAIRATPLCSFPIQGDSLMPPSGAIQSRPPWATELAASASCRCSNAVESHTPRSPASAAICPRRCLLVGMWIDAFSSTSLQYAPDSTEIVRQGCRPLAYWMAARSRQPPAWLLAKTSGIPRCRTRCGSTTVVL